MSEEKKETKVAAKEETKKVAKKTASKKTAPKKAETKKEEVKKAAPKKAEAKKAEAKKAETKKAEVKEEVKKAEAKKVEVKEEAKKAETKKVEVKVSKKAKEPKKVISKEEKEALKQTKKTNRKLWFEKNKAGLAIFTICFVLLALVGTVLSTFLLNDGKRTAITFEGGKVTKEVFQIYYKILGPQYIMYYGQDENAVKQVVAQELGKNFYLKELAKKEGIKLSAEDKKEIDEQFKNKEFMQQLESLKIDPKLFRELTENDFLVKKLIEKKEKEVKEEEINKLIAEKYKDQDMNKYLTRHILFKTKNEMGESLPANEKEQVRIKAQGVLNRVLAGEDFAKLAKEFSDDGSKEDGGSIEMYNDGSLVKEYSDAVLKLKNGEVCAHLVESQFGYHIIKLDNKVANGRKELLKQEVVEKWFVETTEKAQITVKPEVITEVKMFDDVPAVEEEPVEEEPVEEKPAEEKK